MVTLTHHDWRVITLEDWALIRRLAAEGVPKARIAERLGISRRTVLKAVRSESPPRYVRAPVASSFVVFEPRVRALLAETPDMPATVLAERVGWSGSSARWDLACGARGSWCRATASRWSFAAREALSLSGTRRTCSGCSTGNDLAGPALEGVEKFPGAELSLVKGL